MHVLVVILLSVLGPTSGTRYGFFKNMDRTKMVDGARRVFGGIKVDLTDFPQACLLTDSNWYTRCSGAIVAPRWVLTAAHCIEGGLAYIKYNTKTPNKDGNHTSISRLFRHPEYKVIQEDEGRGMDVTQLHHDIGLVKSFGDMILSSPVPKPLERSRQISPNMLNKLDVMVMGFGRTEAEDSLGEQLFAAKLTLQPCERVTWYHCVCGVAAPGQRATGVCSGDSGGPVVYNGIQVGVTSMGPLECVTSLEASPGATSVFTSLFNYVDLVESTIKEMSDGTMRSVPLCANCEKPVRLFIVMMSMILKFVE